MSIEKQVSAIGLPTFWPVTNAASMATLVALATICGLVFSDTGTLSKQARSLAHWVQGRIRAWMYLFNGPRMIQDGFEKANGNPFEINAPDSRYVFVSSPKHIKELESAPVTVLSLQAATKQMLQPMYTMHGFDWFDGRGTEGVGFMRAIRTLLTNNLPEILPVLKTGQRHSQVYPMSIKLVALTNAVSFFGEEMAKNEQFMESALNYVEATLICAEIIKLLPRFLAPLIGGILGRRLKSQKIVFDALLPIAEDRCRERDLKAAGQTVPHHADCIQWIMETSPRSRPRTPERIVHELMAIWFGSVHAITATTTFAIHDLCLHPEYVQTLRQELHAEYGEFERTSRGLPLLDSFIKESARLTPVESMSTRRAALETFRLSDGTTVHPGEWACTPVQSIMQSSQYFPEPMDFRGFRFAQRREEEDIKGWVVGPQVRCGC
ncbi:ent-kaurene oxidase [Diaporthe helianthi]|uniref:Ent-kaurene oxidase n=1 Tax=Diaporthe helianthi TaxID=158607 RepID=A0A2P5HUR2_DIAHE|nr:ent-kaurene oxidase [Diaporthe helianthi]